MRYTSTRDASVSVDAATAVIEGISADGGLFVPESLPILRWQDLLGLEYPRVVDKLLRAFFDFDVGGVATAAYKRFDSEPAPIVKLDDNLFVLELWHGGTCAFPDLALAVFSRLLAKAKAEKNASEKTLVLVATNGDTGAATLEAFKDSEGFEVCVFYPTDGAGAVQKLAMQTQAGGNVRAVGINGSLDDAQATVKNALVDEGLKNALAENNISMSSANSVNIGRLVPQIAYYFSAYCDLVDSGEISGGDRIDFVVPTGSCGNILAGLYACKMGLPINKLVCASNANNVLTDFIDSGIYDANRELLSTDSPAMDTLIASNLERIIFEMSGRNAELTCERMSALAAGGRYSVTQHELEEIHTVFAGDFASDDDTEDAVADMFDEYGYLIDTHTAAAYAVASRREAVRPVVLLSTGNPYKHAAMVLRALGEDPKGEVTADTLDELEEITAMEIPDHIRQVFSAEVRFGDTVAVDDVLGYIAEHYAKKPVE